LRYTRQYRRRSINAYCVHCGRHYPVSNMFNPSPKQLKILKAALFVTALLPFARLVLFAFTERLGANPIEFITRNSGDWTLYFLCITLAVTPLRRLTSWHWLIKLRRMVGLFAFFYALLHFTTFLWFDHFFDLNEMLKDVVKRPFITVGFTAFLLLIPLAVTSTNRMVKRLGGKRWQWLHRAIYLIAPLGILHFWWMKAGKHDFSQPILFGIIVALLLVVRVYWKFGQPRTQKRQVRPTPT
jgi:sulfoxide reductase heme-binding subunit YedZ